MDIIKVSFDVNDKNLRVEFFNSAFPEAIKALNAGSKPKWGMMTAQQMTEHLIWGFYICTGKFEVECYYPENIVKRFKPFLYSNMPTQQDFKNPFYANGLPELKCAGLEQAKTELLGALELFINMYTASPQNTYTHPVFGKMDMEEWHRGSYKHCFHHLLQFELIHQNV